MEKFLDRPENAQFRGVVIEQFKQINDICIGGMNLLVNAYRRSHLEKPEKASAQELSMRLFLDDRPVFQHAWSRYLLLGGSPTLSVYSQSLGGKVVGDQQVQRLEEEMRRWFLDKAKGECEVTRFGDDGETIVLVSRGSYMRTVACWKDNEIGFETFRPASEDVLVYDAKASKLTIKTSLLKDREQYVRAFATHIGGDPALAEAAASEAVFSLLPLQDGSFDYAGNDVITSIDLARVKLKPDAAEEPLLDVKSADVRRTLDRYGLSLTIGQLTYARFRFHLRPPGEKPVSVTFEIEPPSRTDLTQKHYAEIIENYLAEQKVKLS